MRDWGVAYSILYFPTFDGHMCFHPFSRDEQRDPMGLMVRLHSSSYVRSRTDRQQAPFSQDHQKTITKEHRCCLLSTVSQRCLLSGEKKFRPTLYFRQHLIFIVVRTNRKLANFYYVVNKVTLDSQSIQRFRQFSN